MTGVRPGFPEDLGDWSVAGVCYESARLMLKHFGDMLRVALLFTFPASMIKVWHIQFHPHEIQESIWTELFVNVLVDGVVAQLLFISGFVVTLEVLRDRMYPEDGCPKTFFNAMKHAYRRPPKALTDPENPLLNEAPTTPDPTKPPIPIDKLWKVFGLLCLFVIVYIRLWTTGEYFMPQAVAEMGLPPWTASMFTALAGAYTGLSTSYFHLTFLLLCSWADAPRSTPPK